MKLLSLSFGRLLILLLALTTTAPAAVIYSGLQDVTIPLSFDGVYVNVVTNATSSNEPSGWATGPWINPFWGGTVIGSNDQLRPSVIMGTTGAEQVLNQAFGTEISSALFYAPGYNGSETHVGSATNQFQIGITGYIGFMFEQAGETHYGWLRMTLESDGTGILHDWAYNSLPDESIYAGMLVAVPEPRRSLFMILGMTAMLGRRRRS